MKERNLGRYLSLAALVIMGAICAGLYYFAFTLPPATPAPIEPATVTASPVPTRTAISSPTMTPSATRPPATPTLTPTATATRLPVKTVIKTSTPRPAPTMTPTAAPEGCHIETNQIYVIKHGDSLWKISECAYGTGTRYLEIYETNPQLTGPARLIHAGNSLWIPSWR